MLARHWTSKTKLAVVPAIPKYCQVLKAALNLQVIPSSLQIELDTPTRTVLLQCLQIRNETIEL